MSILSNQILAETIEAAKCSDAERINQIVAAASGDYMVAVIGVGGSGITGTQQADVAETLNAISWDDAGTTNGLIEDTSWQIVSSSLGGDPGT